MKAKSTYYGLRIKSHNASAGFLGLDCAFIGELDIYYRFEINDETFLTWFVDGKEFVLE